jgi:hypothetical protein
MLVVQELNQNNEYARAESIRDLSQMWADIYQFDATNDIKRLKSKSITDPGEMTDDELRMLDTYYSLVMNAELAQAVMAQSGLIAGTQADWAVVIANQYFLSPFGRAWFELNGDEFILMSPEFHKTITETIEATPVLTADDYLDELRSRF